VSASPLCIGPTADQLAALRVSYDGLYPGMSFVCFTDRDPASPAFGASFDLPLPISLPKVLAARDSKRRQFAVAAHS
jgi:hypothetical protein